MSITYVTCEPHLRPAVAGSILYDSKDDSVKMFDGTNWIVVNGGTMIKERAFEILTQAEVDGQQWYTVKCSKEVGDWVRTQPSEQWVNHINSGWLFHENNFDMDRELFAFLKLTWS